MMEEIDPIEAGLRKIRARRQVQWYLAPVVPIAVLLFVLAGYYISFAVVLVAGWSLLGVFIWFAIRIWSTRCPRCREYFFVGPTGDRWGMGISKNECQHCGLPLYRPGKDSFF